MSMRKTLYVGDYSIDRCASTTSGEIVCVGSSEDLPDALVEDLKPGVAMVFDGDVLNVRGWSRRLREQTGIDDFDCDEYWRGSLRPATREEVLAVFFGDDVPSGDPRVAHG